MRAFVADLDAWSSAAKAEDARADSEPAAFAPRDDKAGAPVRGATRATVTATGDVAGNPKPSSSSFSEKALRDGMPTLADLNAAEQNLDGHGVGGVFAEAAKREAEAKAEDLSVSGATRADREKLLAGLRDAPARERRWAAAREKEKGNELFKAREYRSAIEAYDVSIALDAANPAPFANRAAAYMKLRRWSDAARDCDAALALDPEHFKALLRRGACALEANEQDAASVALRDFELCAAIEARRRTKEGEPSDAELVRLTALAKKTLNETREKTARAAMRRVAIEEDDPRVSSSSSSEPSTKSPPVVAPARRGPMVIEEIVEDPEPKSSKIKIKIEEASDSDDDDAASETPIEPDGSSIDIAARVAALKDEGNMRFARGAYEDAIASYDEAIRAFEKKSNESVAEPPVDARARAVLYANRAASLLKRGDFARAERDANDAIACDPAYVKGFHRRAAARAGLNAFEGALEDYEKVVRAAPESEALRREVNACMEKAAEAMLGGLNGGARGDVAAALSSGAKAVTIEPDSDDDSDDDDDDDDDDAPETKAAPSAIETKAPERTPPRSSQARAVVIVEEDSSDDEEEPREGITTTNEHEKHESTKETFETSEQHGAFGVSQTSPETKKSPEAPSAASASASAHKDRGNALFRAGDYAGAESAYSAAIAADPTNAAAFYANRAAAHLKLGAHDAALRDAEDALALDPGHARARHRRAAALAALGPSRAAEAAAEYARVAAAHPGHAGVAAEAAAAAEAARRAAEDHAAKEDRKEDLSEATKPKPRIEGETAKPTKPTKPIVAGSPLKRQSPRAPRTATEFERGCASLRGDPDALLLFLGSVDDAELPRVLKHSVSAKILGAYCVAFASALDEREPGSPFANEASKTRTATTLAALAATPRFALAAAALGAADKRAIARVFEALGEACASETRDAWR